MKLCVVLALACMLGCSRATPATQATAPAASGDAARKQTLELEEVNAKQIRERIERDAEGVLFPEAIKVVRRMATNELKQGQAAKTEVAAENFYAVGNDKWEVTGTCRRPDQSGKIVTTHWSAEVSIVMGRLQVGAASLPFEE